MGDISFSIPANSGNRGSTVSIPSAAQALAILDNISDAVASLDFEWRLTYANATTFHMARMPASEMLGDSLWELFPELLGTPAEDSLRRAMAERVRGSCEYFHAPYQLWVELDAHPTPGGITLFARDITARKQAEEERASNQAILQQERERLRLNEERIRVALESNPTVVFNQDLNLAYTWVYNALQEFRAFDWIGLSDEVLGETATPLIDLKRRVLSTGLAARGELALEIDGRRRHYQVNLRPLRGERGDVTGLTGSVTEVTEQRLAQERIEQQQEQLRLVIDTMPALVAYLDRGSRYRFVNRRFSECFGRPAAEFEGRTIAEAFGPEAWEYSQAYVLRAMAGEIVAFVGSYVFPDGARVLKIVLVPDRSSDGEVRGAVAVIEDVTEAHRAEEKLRRSEEQHRFLANALPQMVWVAGPDGRTEFLNDHWFEYTGATREEGIAAWSRVVPPADAAAAAEAFRAAVAARRPLDVEHRLRRGSDGVERWHLSRLKPVCNTAGEVMKWIGTAIDIHDRKTSEMELRKARRDLSDIVESITEAFIALDREWRFVYVNQRVADKIGKTREELIGRNMWEVAPEAVTTLFYPKYRQVMERRIPLHFEMPYPPNFWYEVHAYPTEAGMTAYIVDRSEHKRTQEALRQKAKLESIGLLAGGVAHDFNNLLVGILGTASLAQEMMEPERPEHEMLRVICDSAQRAADLTRQMLTYAGKSAAERQAVDLNRIVVDTAQLLRSTVPPAIQVTLDLAPHVPVLMGDAGQVQQVVLNLLTNAVEAIPARSPGWVRVSTSVRRQLQEWSAGMEAMTPGEYVVLEVADCGQGMTQEVQDRIFDPFFTTKFAGRGLGLAAVQGIVRSHGGAIQVQSTPGYGTTFQVVLRAGEPEVVADREEENEPAPGSGTILVIDDEPAVRSTSARMLAHFGYKVLVAETAGKGIELFRANRHKLHAMLVDVSMPDQSGFDLLRQVAGQLDGIRVVLSSGHGRQDLESELSQFPQAEFLRKPYRTKELLKAISQTA